MRCQVLYYKGNAVGRTPPWGRPKARFRSIRTLSQFQQGGLLEIHLSSLSCICIFCICIYFVFVFLLYLYLILLGYVHLWSISDRPSLVGTLKQYKKVLFQLHIWTEIIFPCFYTIYSDEVNTRPTLLDCRANEVKIVFLKYTQNNLSHNSNISVCTMVFCRPFWVLDVIASPNSYPVSQWVSE